ncbi:MAG: hypothetical protein LBG12_13515 [Synergistaceae bacterium]|nr:hypothetical protein [Synergistaceae bacterium]
MIFGRIGIKTGKTGRVRAAFFAVALLTFTVCIASLSSYKFSDELSPQSRAGMFRALEIIDGSGGSEASCQVISRSPATRAWAGSGHCADMSFICRAGEREPAYDFAVPAVSRAGGVDTVTRE